MIIATKEVDINKVRQIYTDPIQLRQYVLSLVPKIYRHTKIVGNQALYISSVILQDVTIPLDVRREISTALLKNNNVCGILGEFIDIRTVERRVNKNKVNRFYEEANR